MKSIFNFIILTVLMVTFFQFHSYSQTFESQIKNLSESADVILTGKVTNQKSQWNTDQTRISTQSTIEVDEYLKGNKIEKSIIVTTPGGEVGEVGELYTHMPRFNKDEDVLLFVKKDKKDMSYKVLNGEDGKLTLYKDKNTGEIVTSFNKKISVLKKEIKNYVDKQ